MDPLFPVRQFAEIDGSPHPPCNKAGELNPEDSGYTGAMADRRQLPDCAEGEVFLLRPLDGRGNIPSQCLSLPQSMLGGWGMKTTLPVRNAGAIAESLNPRPLFQFKRRLRKDATRMLAARQANHLR